MSPFHRKNKSDAQSVYTTNSTGTTSRLIRTIINGDGELRDENELQVIHDSLLTFDGADDATRDQYNQELIESAKSRMKSQPFYQQVYNDIDYQDIQYKLNEQQLQRQIQQMQKEAAEEAARGNSEYVAVSRPKVDLSKTKNNDEKPEARPKQRKYFSFYDDYLQREKERIDEEEAEEREKTRWILNPNGIPQASNNTSIHHLQQPNQSRNSSSGSIDVRARNINSSNHTINNSYRSFSSTTNNPTLVTSNSTARQSRASSYNNTPATDAINSVSFYQQSSDSQTGSTSSLGSSSTFSLHNENIYKSSRSEAGLKTPNKELLDNYSVSNYAETIGTSTKASTITPLNVEKPRTKKNKGNESSANSKRYLSSASSSFYPESMYDDSFLTNNAGDKNGNDEQNAADSVPLPSISPLVTASASLHSVSSVGLNSAQPSLHHRSGITANSNSTANTTTNIIPAADTKKDSVVQKLEKQASALVLKGQKNNNGFSSSSSSLPSSYYSTTSGQPHDNTTPKKSNLIQNNINQQTLYSNSPALVPYTKSESVESLPLVSSPSSSPSSIHSSASSSSSASSYLATTSDSYFNHKPALTAYNHNKKSSSNYQTTSVSSSNRTITLNHSNKSPKRESLVTTVSSDQLQLSNTPGNDLNPYNYPDLSKTQATSKTMGAVQENISPFSIKALYDRFGKSNNNNKLPYPSEKNNQIPVATPQVKHAKPVKKTHEKKRSVSSGHHSLPPVQNVPPPPPPQMMWNEEYQYNTPVLPINDDHQSFIQPVTNYQVSNAPTPVVAKQSLPKQSPKPTKVKPAAPEKEKVKKQIAKKSIPVQSEYHKFYESGPAKVTHRRTTSNPNYAQSSYSTRPDEKVVPVPVESWPSVPVNPVRHSYEASEYAKSSTRRSVPTGRVETLPAGAAGSAAAVMAANGTSTRNGAPSGVASNSGDVDAGAQLYHKYLDSKKAITDFLSPLKVLPASEAAKRTGRGHQNAIDRVGQTGVGIPSPASSFDNDDSQSGYIVPGSLFNTPRSAGGASLSHRPQQREYNRHGIPAGAGLHEAAEAAERLERHHLQSQQSLHGGGGLDTRSFRSSNAGNSIRIPITGTHLRDVKPSLYNENGSVDLDMVERSTIASMSVNAYPVVPKEPSGLRRLFQRSSNNKGTPRAEQRELREESARYSQAYMPPNYEEQHQPMSAQSVVNREAVANQSAGWGGMNGGLDMMNVYKKSGSAVAPIVQGIRSLAQLSVLLKPLDSLADSVPLLLPAIVFVEGFILLWMLHQISALLETVTGVIKLMSTPAVAIANILGASYRTERAIVNNLSSNSSY